ncbi:MAG TPA: preprotein translocase subunit SecE [Bacillus sp. (in: firmicutes)]|uniref:Protein translocase subunit SecE n=1 Tax=Bacillus oleivorans TaxID=1448271 RepID=A0A285D766_9BACI|nr:MULTISPECIES: preprotein translocase subunit SecE [Bacillus]SNX75660.1 protein translocase subunit secE/sec61 gamma [Bacillus oleivorans]HWO78577.1 preprotein translocase subunit SecE [Bacillus sp. (in: firmicutes)]
MQFFRNVASEMKKVSWPKRKELVRYTVTVIVTVAFVSVFFAVVDLGISSVIELILE